MNKSSDLQGKDRPEPPDRELPDENRGDPITLKYSNEHSECGTLGAGSSCSNSLSSASPRKSSYPSCSPS